MKEKRAIKSHDGSVLAANVVKTNLEELKTGMLGREIESFLREEFKSPRLGVFIHMKATRSLGQHHHQIQDFS
jgi:hypothetical protein